MSLIDCPECSKPQSEHTDKCQNCGFPITYYLNSPEQKYKKPNYEEQFQLINKRDSFFDEDPYFLLDKGLNEDVSSSIGSTSLVVFQNGIDLQDMGLKISFAQIVNIASKHLDDRFITRNDASTSYRKASSFFGLNENEVKAKFNKKSPPEHLLEITYYEQDRFKELRLLFYTSRAHEKKVNRLKSCYDNYIKNASDVSSDKNTQHEKSSENKSEPYYPKGTEIEFIKKYLALFTEKIEGKWKKHISEDTGDLWIALVLLLPLFFFWVPFYRDWKPQYKIIISFYALIALSIITPDKNNQHMASQSNTSTAQSDIAKKSYGTLSIGKLCKVMTSESYGRPLSSMNATAKGNGKYKIAYTRASDSTEWALLCWKEGKNRLLWRTIDSETGRYGRVRNSQYDERIYFHDKGDKVKIEILWADGSSRSKTMDRSELLVY